MLHYCNIILLLPIAIRIAYVLQRLPNSTLSHESMFIFNRFLFCLLYLKQHEKPKFLLLVKIYFMFHRKVFNLANFLFLFKRK